MAIIVSAPDAFFDCEVWEFDLTVSEPDGSGPMNLAGSDLFVRFKSLSDNAVIGECDTTRGDGSLTILDAAAGTVRISLTSAGRTWSLPTVRPGELMLASTVVGDLFRQPMGQPGQQRGIGRIEIRVLPSTGVRSA